MQKFHLTTFPNPSSHILTSPALITIAIIIMDFKTRWLTYFDTLDASGNGFIGVEDAPIVAYVSR